MSEYFGIFKGLKDLELPTNDMDLYEGYFADFYDHFTINSKEDMDIYIPQMEEVNGKVLELACGTGRILLDTARKGYNITGLDLSDSMLEILNNKIKHEPAEIQDNIKLLKEDMTSFQLNEKYGVCILGATSICLLENDDLVLKMMNNVYEHLETGGRFIFDYTVSEPNLNKPIELEPIRTFTKVNKDNKQFVLIGEKKNYDDMVSDVNFYAEIIDKSQNTIRNFGHTRKRLLTDKIISQNIKKTSFKLKNSFVMKEGKIKIRFVVLEK